MYYTTVRVQPVKDHEREAIDEAIEKAMSVLYTEANAPIVLTNVVPVVLPECLVLVVMAEKWEPKLIPEQVMVKAVPLHDGLKGLLGR